MRASSSLASSSLTFPESAQQWKVVSLHLCLVLCKFRPRQIAYWMDIRLENLGGSEVTRGSPKEPSSEFISAKLHQEGQEEKSLLILYQNPQTP